MTLLTWFYMVSVSFAFVSHLSFMLTYALLVRNWRKSSIGRMMQWSSLSVVFTLFIVLYNNVLFLTQVPIPSVPSWVFPVALFGVGFSGVWQIFELVRVQRRRPKAVEEVHEILAQTKETTTS